MTVEATVLDIILYDVAHRTPIIAIDGEQLRGCDEFHTIDEFLVGETIDVEFSVRGVTVETILNERTGVEPHPKQFDPANLNVWQHLVYGELVTLERGEEQLTGMVDAGVDVIPFDIPHTIDQDSDTNRRIATVKEGDFVRIQAQKLYVSEALDGHHRTTLDGWGTNRAFEKLDIDEVAEACKSEAETLRKRAYCELARREENAYVDVLLEAKRHVNRSDAEHWVVLDALKSIRDDRAVSWFIEILEGESNPYKRRKAAEVLGDYNDELGIDEAIDPLLTTIKTAETDDLRYTAANSLGRIGLSSLTPHLVTLLGEATDPRIRIATLSALGWMDIEESTRAIIEALDDSDPEVRVKAIWEVSNRQAARSVQPLVRLLRDDDEEFVRERAADAFQTIGNAYLVQSQAESDVVDVKELQQAFDALVIVLHDSSPGIRQMAMLALSCHEEARDRLEEVIDESADETAVELAQTAIRKIERKGAYEHE